MRKLLFIVLVVLATARSEEIEERCLLGNCLKVKTSNGFVKGYLGESCRTGKQFVGFRGIPYAEPPLEELRFRDPVPKNNWKGTWNATYDRPSCIQMMIEGFSFPSKSGFSEDCLYLNVYTPNLRYLNYGLGPRKAVMVFIHPGAFNSGGSTDSFLAPDFLIDQDVVVVTFNYRLGALGFLSFQNEVVPGNAGLKDQNLALKWVKNNIRNFGGDPSRVTIFGESAGSASVNYHLLSKASTGLFTKAIMESGSAISRWAYSSPELSLRKAHGLAKKVGCSQKEFAKVLECMQKVSAEAIVKIQQEALTLQELLTLSIIAFHPTTEPNVPGAFLTADPLDLMYSGNFTKVPAIIGLNSNEGLLIYPLLKKYDPSGRLISIFNLDLSRFAPASLRLKPFTRPAIHVHNMISKFYFNSKAVSKSTILNILELVSDVMFTLPIQLTASLLSSSSAPIYNYYFTYEGGYNIMKSKMNMSEVPGVCHGDDLGYLFYYKSLHNRCGSSNVSGSSLDEIMIDRMTRMWTNFAKTGQPTPNLDPKIGTKWEPFTLTNGNYLNIGSEFVLSNGLKLDSMLFWKSLIKDVFEMGNPGAGEPDEEVTDDLKTSN